MQMSILTDIISETKNVLDLQWRVLDSERSEISYGYQ